MSSDHSTEIWRKLWAWLRWADMQSGKPASYKSTLCQYPFDDPGISDADAMAVDRAVAALRRESPLHDAYLMCYLRRESVYAVASRFHLSEDEAWQALDDAAAWIESEIAENG